MSTRVSEARDPDEAGLSLAAIPFAASPVAASPVAASPVAASPVWREMLEWQAGCRAEMERRDVRGHRRVLRFINDLYPARGRLLQVGSGLGFLLAALREDGWRVHGIDPSAYGCEFARDRHGVLAHDVMLREAGIPDDAFDVVILSRGLDSLPEPMATLLDISRILRPGGHCLLEMPWPGAGLPAPAAFAGAGLRDVHASVVVRSVTGARLAWKLGEISQSLVAQNALVGLVRRLGLDRGAVALPRWRRRRVWLQKVRAMVRAPGDGGGTAADLPAWLADVAGVVTERRGLADIRRGHPWREPDRRHVGGMREAARR